MTKWQKTKTVSTTKYDQASKIKELAWKIEKLELQLQEIQSYTEIIKQEMSKMPRISWLGLTPTLMRILSRMIQTLAWKVQ